MPRRKGSEQPSQQKVTSMKRPLADITDFRSLAKPDFEDDQPLNEMQIFGKNQLTVIGDSPFPKNTT